ncbi:hypothetical protein BDW02DRAFT_631453, partial [Decorospora gaudefroyi]
GIPVPSLPGCQEDHHHAARRQHLLRHDLLQREGGRRDLQRPSGSVLRQDRRAAQHRRLAPDELQKGPPRLGPFAGRRGVPCGNDTGRSTARTRCGGVWSLQEDAALPRSYPGPLVAERCWRDPPRGHRASQRRSAGGST